MDACYQCGIKRTYEFNQTKRGVATLGESKLQHFQSMNEWEWKLGEGTVGDVYDYKNLEVLKNYVGSFSSNMTDNIEKARKKAGIISSSKFDRRRSNPFVYVKFWIQACLPSLLFRSELFTLSHSLLLKLERCQLWSFKNLFRSRTESYFDILEALRKCGPFDYIFQIVVR